MEYIVIVFLLIAAVVSGLDISRSQAGKLALPGPHGQLPATPDQLSASSQTTKINMADDHIDNSKKTIAYTAFRDNIVTTTYSITNSTETNISDTNATCNVVYTTEIQTNKLGLVIFICVVSFVICFGNCLVISVFARVKGFRTLANYFICQLAIADLLVGLVMPYYASVMLYEPFIYDVGACVFRCSIFMLSAAGSASSLLALAYDRHFAITKPLKYKTTVGKSHFIKLAFMVWTIPISAGFIGPFIFHRTWSADCPEKCDYYTILPMWYHRFIVVPFLVVSIIIITIINVVTYCRVRKYFKSYSLVAATNANSSNQDNNIKDKDIKLLKITIRVLVVLYISWVPYMTIMGLIAYGGMLDNPIVFKARYFMTLLFVCNSAINPIIYALSLPSYRKEFANILRIKTSNKKSNPLTQLISRDTSSTSNQSART